LLKNADVQAFVQMEQHMRSQRMGYSAGLAGLATGFMGRPPPIPPSCRVCGHYRAYPNGLCATCMQMMVSPPPSGNLSSFPPPGAYGYARLPGAGYAVPPTVSFSEA
jgi:hypothetical protein